MAWLARPLPTALHILWHEDKIYDGYIQEIKLNAIVLYIVTFVSSQLLLASVLTIPVLVYSYGIVEFQLNDLTSTVKEVMGYSIAHPLLKIAPPPPMGLQSSK